MDQPKFALVSINLFDAFWLKSPPVNTSNLQAGKHEDLKKLLQSYPDEFWYYIDPGTILFKLPDSWRLVHLFLELLAAKKEAANLVYFDGELFGNFSPDLVPHLKTFGVTAHSIEPPRTSQR